MASPVLPDQYQSVSPANVDTGSSRGRMVESSYYQHPAIATDANIHKWTALAARQAQKHRAERHLADAQRVG